MSTELPRCGHCKTPLHPLDDSEQAAHDAMLKHLWRCKAIPTDSDTVVIEMAYQWSPQEN